MLDRLELRAEEEAGGSQQLERALWYPGRRWVKIFIGFGFELSYYLDWARKRSMKLIARQKTSVLLVASSFK